jgi:hypothetical protein
LTFCGLARSTCTGITLPGNGHFFTGTIIPFTFTEVAAPLGLHDEVHPAVGRRRVSGGPVELTTVAIPSTGILHPVEQSHRDPPSDRKRGGRLLHRRHRLRVPMWIFRSLSGRSDEDLPLYVLDDPEPEDPERAHSLSHALEVIAETFHRGEGTVVAATEPPPPPVQTDPASSSAASSSSRRRARRRGSTTGSRPSRRSCARGRAVGD